MIGAQHTNSCQCPGQFPAPTANAAAYKPRHPPPASHLMLNAAQHRTYLCACSLHHPITNPLALPTLYCRQNCKYAVHCDVLPDGTVVPAGAQVIYSAYVGNRMSAVWGPDPLAFRPDRWLEMEKAPSPINYLTFNAGVHAWWKRCGGC